MDELLNTKPPEAKWDAGDLGCGELVLGLRTLLPQRYAGFVAATHASYDKIERAGLAVGKIKPK